MHSSKLCKKALLRHVKQQFYEFLPFLLAMETFESAGALIFDRGFDDFKGGTLRLNFEDKYLYL
jgi:hypothetical protein